MTISYQWICDYLPEKPSPEKLADLLTSVGLEVESLEKYEEVKDNLQGLIIGEVLEVHPHPNADKLKLTRVNIGTETPLAIVCGAPNVAVGQRVVVAPVGATIYPAKNAPVTMKVAKIRGAESLGMICAEDEIGLGESHEGIMVLDPAAKPGTPAKDYFQLTEDWIYEIGLTPNRMDAMSHIGVARDVCACLSNLEGKTYKVRLPEIDNFILTSPEPPIKVRIENNIACPRYAGVSISNVKVGTSPEWLQKRLKAIGVRAVNNIVDITNYVLHECGQPLHAFDADAIKGSTIVVKNLPENTSFITLDEKERKLHPEDLMICDAEEGMCIAGIFGGLHSGVQQSTTRIFLESAFFNPVSIRRSSFRHGLRTDAALRFEKGVDISNVIFALKRAAQLICELSGGKIASEIVDEYPDPAPKKEVQLTYAYLKKISGNDYPPGQVKNILNSLNFEIQEENNDQLRISVPYSKPDISLPADIAEEIMRIDGYDRIQIPSHITISPSLSVPPDREALREKAASYLSSNGFHEIFTNSITNSQYYDSAMQGSLVRMMNSLSTELDIMRPSMLETGLESIAYNLNRRQNDLLFYEFGKIYSQGKEAHQYIEGEKLCLYITGNKRAESWLYKPEPVDRYFMTGHLKNILAQLGLREPAFESTEDTYLETAQNILFKKRNIGLCGSVSGKRLERFDIRQPVWYTALDWGAILSLSANVRHAFTEIPRYPAVRRDLALILHKSVQFGSVEKIARSVKSPILQEINLFDVFESEKLGTDKKSYAVSFIFQHPEKTLTDKEIDKVMQQMIQAFENQLQAGIRK